MAKTVEEELWEIRAQLDFQGRMLQQLSAQVKREIDAINRGDFAKRCVVGVTKIDQSG